MSGIDKDPKKLCQLDETKNTRTFECEALEEFPVGVSNLVALEELHFAKCRALTRILENFANLTKLKILRMFECEALKESLLE